VANQIASRIGGRKLAKWLIKYKLEIDSAGIRQYEGILGIGFDDLFGPMRKRFRDTAAMDLVCKMLTINHKKRITARNALNHDFFASLRDA
jgi:serine/threonine protein kinase